MDTSHFQKARCKDTKRLIICLPTIHKILTAALTNRIYNQVLKNNISQEKRKAVVEWQPDEGQTSEGTLLLGPANSQDTVKYEEQDDSYQQISFASPYLQLQNSQLVKTRNWEDRWQYKTASNCWRNPSPEGRR